MEGRGECVKVLPPEQRRDVVLVNPGVHSSTAAVYARSVARSEPATEPVNDLQAPAIALYPEIADTLASLRAAGAGEVRMTGSGSTVFGFVPTASRAEEIAQAFRSRGLSAWAAHTLEPHLV